MDPWRGIVVTLKDSVQRSDAAVHEIIIVLHFVLLLNFHIRIEQKGILSNGLFLCEMQLALPAAAEENGAM